MCCLSSHTHPEPVYQAKLPCCWPAVEQCIKLGNQRAANRVRQDFKLSERRWAWIKVAVLLLLSDVWLLAVRQQVWPCTEPGGPARSGILYLHHVCSEHRADRSRTQRFAGISDPAWCAIRQAGQPVSVQDGAIVSTPTLVV